MTTERYLEAKALTIHEVGVPPKFQFESIFIDLETVRSDQVVVKFKASGICHTDVGAAVGALPPHELPVVLGHEGAGWVHYIPKDYSGQPLKVGDAVLCGMTQCKSCDSCKKQRICQTMIPDHYFGEGMGRTEELEKPGSGKKIHTGFFNQSSFATHGVVMAEAIVKVDPSLPLEVLAPMVCGVQTGFGTVVNTLWPFATRQREWEKLPYWKEAGDSTVAAKYMGEKPHTGIAIFGLGGVGCSALAGAVLCGFDDIIVVDLAPSKLEFAKKWGATHTIDANQEPEKVIEAVKAISPKGNGVMTVAEATGVGKVVQMAWECVAPGGQVAQVGAAPDVELKIPIVDALSFSKSWTAVLEGESVTPVFVPYMVNLFKAGKLDILKDMVKTYTPDKLGDALQDQHSGKTIKPVILWS